MQSITEALKQLDPCRTCIGFDHMSMTGQGIVAKLLELSGSWDPTVAGSRPFFIWIPDLSYIFDKNLQRNLSLPISSVSLRKSLFGGHQHTNSIKQLSVSVAACKWWRFQ